mgnify:CR=1 FL=1
MTKRKSMQDVFADKNDIVLMKEIVDELRKDRREDEAHDLEVGKLLADKWEKYRTRKHIKNDFNEYVKAIRAR